MTRYAQILILCILSICLIGGVVAAGTDGVTAPENGSMTVDPGLDVEPVETVVPLDEEAQATADETVTAAPNPASTIILGSATVEAGKHAVIPVSVANLTEIEGIGGWVFYNQGAGMVTSVNLTGPLAGANLTYNADHPGHLQFAITTTAPFTVGATPVQIAEIHFDTYRETSGSYSLYPEATYSTKFNESYFEHAVEGLLITTPPPLPDLVGYLDPAPPEYIKKYSNGTIYMNPTFVIGNIGVACVTDDIVNMVTFVGQSANYTVTDDIAAGANYTIFTDITIDPSYTGALNVVEVKDTGSVTLIITAGVDISPGTKKVSIDINPDHTIEELRYDNNYIEAQTTVTYTDLRPILDITLVSGLSSSNTTIQEDVLPGTYRVTYGVENKAPGVYSEPTWLRVSKNGVNTTDVIPALQPGENWTRTETINLDRYAGSVTYTVEANAAGPNGEEPKERIKYPDSGKVSKTVEKEYASFKPVTVIFPHTNVTSDVSRVVPIELTNISSAAPVVSFSIPVTYDPSVVSYQGYSGSGVSVSSTGYGRLLVKGDGLSLSTDTKVVDLWFRAQSESGRTSEIGSTKDAYVRTTNNRYLELDITKGALVQERFTDARVYLWAPTASPVDSNVTFTVYVYNSKATPVNVSANVTITGGTVLWSQDEVALGAYQSRYFWVDTWKPSATATYTLTARIDGDDNPGGNSANTTVRIVPYELNITPQNRQYWESYYGYNVTAVQDQYFSLGTYFTANQPGYVNASLSIWYANGTPVDLSKDRPFYLYYYPAKRQIYSYSSSWNSAMWYYIRPMELGTYNYSIDLESRGTQTYVNGTIVVREQNVDIKVLNSTTLDNETGGEIWFDVFNREPSEGREVVITAAAGAEGRTLQGLDYLIGYPHGCPEQTMSPALAVLRVKQYYESRGQLNDERNATYQAAMLEAYKQMKAPDGYNAQQLAKYKGTYGDGSGGWAWGRNSVPSMFYTLYPNYVFSELWQDMDKDPDYWGFNLTNTSEINLTASTVWLIDKQDNNTGGWYDWGYISNSYEWTGFISEKFVGEFDYLTPEGQRMVNESLNKSFDYLVRGNYEYQSATPVAYAVFGIDAIRDHYSDNATLNSTANTKLDELQNRLLALRRGDAVNGYYWSSWAYEDTANAVLALNRTGLPADNETVRGGIRYLVSVYDTNGRWGSTRGTAAVIEALTQVQIPSTVNFNVQIGVEDGSGTPIRAPQNYTFNNTNTRVSFKLSDAELTSLYGNTAGANRTGKITITGKTDTATDATKLVVAVQSRQKVPKSIAFATIPDEFIDPIATDLFLDVTVPAPETGIVVGETVDTVFTVNNTGDSRTILILEIPTGEGIAFDGSEMAADMAYYRDGGSKVYISHMYNATAQTLYVYPGSDNESQPSVVSGEVKNFYVPLNFTKSGDVSVEARIYPMYDDENMALGNAIAYVKGYGNLTHSVVDEDLAPLNADFYIDNMETPVASGASNITTEVLEGNHSVSIRHTSGTVTRTVNTTLTVNTGEATEYSAQIATDPTIPHISMVVGDAGDVRIMPPEINDTISEDSLYYWSAMTPAKKTFNSTISSTGGTATIAVEVPVVVREPTAVVNPGDRGWRPNSTSVNDSVTYRYHNTSGWQGPFDASGYISGGVLSIPDVDTGSIDQISVEFIGRPLGDVDGLLVNNVRVVDLRDVVKALRFVAEIPGAELSTTAKFYADVTNDGKVDLQDVVKALRFVAEMPDINEYYQPK